MNALFYVYCLNIFTYAVSLWNFITIILTYLGLMTYKISNDKNVSLVLKRLPKRSNIITENEMSGWIWGWPYIGYITNEQFGRNIQIFTTKNFYKKISESNNEIDIIDEENNEKIKKEKGVKLWYILGNYYHFMFSSRKIHLPKFNDNIHQKNIIDDIIKYYKHNKKCVTYISGKSGTGKSTIALLLAKKINGSICYDFNPTEPGNNFELLYNSVQPIETKPLIVIIEEFDILMTNIHENKIMMHKSSPTQIYDKRTYNTFMDFINLKIYPHVIFILTSNKIIDEINNMDPSYLRNGRINLNYNLEIIL